MTGTEVGKDAYEERVSWKGKQWSNDEERKELSDGKGRSRRIEVRGKYD